MHKQKLETGFRQAREITKKFAKTFYLASLFLPKERKYASYAVYAICRLSDEAVDGPAHSNQTENLRSLESKISSAYTQEQPNEPLSAAFRKTVNNYKIPREYFDALVEGMRMDIKIKRYRDFSSLYEYCYRVAGVIGLIMLKIFGYKDTSAEGYAVKMGTAMQLTNILRDIKEDLARGRIYLPLDEMARFNVSEQQLNKGLVDEDLKALLRFQISRCRKLYNESSSGIKLIDNPLCRFVALCMKEVYSGILDEIEKNNCDVFAKRAYVNKLKKAEIILKIVSERKYL
ncbi:MAG: phytoene/squalene synthase family protein [Candidatus Omnitrophica bacterium]|nr:phytoene/squalene synthase family protein [Candidatus Omnitrophota bacterium]